jgi:signal transduction histidine kinase/ligand-binding sensor domain-containing protein
MVRPVFVVLALTLSAGFLLPLSAQTRGRLPLDVYTARQGLSNDSVTALFTDSRGFLWLGTLDGLSRFDGETFVNFSIGDGLPDRMIWSIAEDRSGAIWVGTTAGAARLSPEAPRPHLFQTFTQTRGEPIDASLVHVDRRGQVLTSCGGDLCRVDGDRLVLDPTLRAAGGLNVHAMRDAPDGTLWVGTDRGLFARRGQEAWRHFEVHEHRGADTIAGIQIDTEGRLWIANGFGLTIFAPIADDADRRPLVERAGTPLTPGSALRLPRAGEVVRITVPAFNPIVLFRDPVIARDGTVWQPSYASLLRIGNGRIEKFDAADGVPIDMTSLAEDSAGRLWIGSRAAGAWRLTTLGHRTFGKADGLASERIKSIFELPDGSVCASSPFGVSCVRDGVTAHGSLWPASTRYPGWGWNQILARDRDGSVYFATGEGIVHWPPLQRLEDLRTAKPIEILTTAHGLSSDDVFRLWIDSKGTLWVSSFGSQPLSRRRQGERRFTSFGPAQGVPEVAPTAFAEDADGTIWIGFYTGGYLRVRNDRFERLDHGLPKGFVRDLRLDSKGGMWVAARYGTARIANPTADARTLAITTFTPAHGLASDSGYCIVELPDGRVAIGSQRGLDLFDPQSNKSTRLTVREGLPSNEVSTALLDRRGSLWIGTLNGLTRIDTIPAPKIAPPPQPLVQSVRIDGASNLVSELGTTSLAPLQLAWPQQRLAIGFVSPYFEHVAPLRYEYRLSGGPWIDAGEQRSILFDHLPAAEGLLEIRAVSAQGLPSAVTRVPFVVLAPFWKRLWFLALCALVLAALIYLLHRVRVQRLLELERMRTRVATDLHDDLGSSLSRISMLSEAAKERAPRDAEPLLDEIADSARGLVDALGDTIWSIDPRRDDGQSLFLRVRKFAGSVFEARSIDLDMHIPPDAASLHLGPEQKRQTYLILKEALNNAARHAGATQVEVRASSDASALRIEIRDNGRGFGVPSPRDDGGGHGLASMQERARRIGGRCEIHSIPDHGTVVSVMVPR